MDKEKENEQEKQKIRSLLGAKLVKILLFEHILDKNCAYSHTKKWQNSQKGTKMILTVVVLLPNITTIAFHYVRLVQPIEMGSVKNNKKSPSE